MDILVQAKNGEATQALRSFIKTQLLKVEKLGVPIRQIRVFLENIARKDSDPHRASVVVDVEVKGKKTISVKSHAHDLYQAVVKVSEDALRHVRKQKEKKLTKLRKHQRELVRDIEE
jgi:ribosomal subunit interface protein